MAQKVGHELQLFANANNSLDLKAIFLGKTNKALLGPERLVIDVQNAQGMFTFIRLKVAKIAGNNDFQKVFSTAEIRK